MIIIGAGMAGCIAAMMNPNAIILEASDTPPTNHNAVLRFREDSVSIVTGIPFNEVTVHKAIWYNDSERPPTPRLCNMYSKKVTNKIISRSIWNLNTVKRYVAPQDFHMRMIEKLGDRIKYGAKVNDITKDKIFFKDGTFLHRGDMPIVSTMPLQIMVDLAYGVSPAGQIPNFNLNRGEFQKISTLRGRVKDSNVHQTIYYPGMDTPIYRATLTGSDLIIEMMGDNVELYDSEISMVEKSFGLESSDVVFEVGGKPTQQYGKISPIDEKVRRRLIYKLSIEHNIFCLGRFGTWRNILLDDVVDDVNVIKNLIEKDLYHNHLNF